MKRLIKIELKKIIYFNTSIVLGSITLALYFLILYLILNLKVNFSGVDFINLYRFPIVWQSISYYAGWYYLLFVLLIIILVGNEFRYKTLRQNVLSGLSRNEVFASKLILIILLALFYTLLVLFSSLIIGFIYTEQFGFNEIFSGIVYIPAFFLQGILYMSIALLISLLLKNTAASIVVFIGVYIFELVLRAYLALASIEIGGFLPFNVIGNLCKRPEINNILTTPMLHNLNTQNTNNYPNHFINLMVAFLYLAIILFSSFKIIRNKDL